MTQRRMREIKAALNKYEKLDAEYEARIKPRRMPDIKSGAKERRVEYLKEFDFLQRNDGWYMANLAEREGISRERMRVILKKARIDLLNEFRSNEMSVIEFAEFHEMPVDRMKLILKKARKDEE